jgi:hypothetical protein
MSVPLTVPPPAIDPTTLAVVRARLEQIADEMDTVFERMAFSPVISDAWDRADGIYSPADGTMIVQGARGLPIFVGVMQYAVASVTEKALRLPCQHGPLAGHRWPGTGRVFRGRHRRLPGGAAHPARPAIPG